MRKFIKKYFWQIAILLAILLVAILKFGFGVGGL